MEDETAGKRRQDSSGEVGPKIAKLRWIGLEREAEELAHSRAAQAGICTEPADTD